MLNKKVAEQFITEFFKYLQKHNEKLVCREITNSNTYKVENVTDTHVYFTGHFPTKVTAHIPNFQFFVDSLTFKIPTLIYFSFNVGAVDRTHTKFNELILKEYGTVENMFQLYLMAIPLETLLNNAFENWEYLHDGQ